MVRRRNHANKAECHVVHGSALFFFLGMHKLAIVLAIGFLSPLSGFSQSFFGWIYDKPISLKLDSVGKKAWQGYLIYQNECYSVAAVAIDSQTMASQVTLGVRLVSNSKYGFSISGDPNSDTLSLTETEIVEFPRNQYILNPPKTTVRLGKVGKWPERLQDQVAAYQHFFEPPSASIQIIGATNGHMLTNCFLPSALCGIWELAQGTSFLSIHADGTLMLFRQKNRRFDAEPPPLNFVAWCATPGMLYERTLGNGIGQEIGRYSIHQDELTVTSAKGEVMVFRRR